MRLDKYLKVSRLIKRRTVANTACDNERVLVNGKEPTEDLKKEIQEYVKHHTAPYKYPRRVVFCKELPKSTSGKIMRNKL